MKLDLIKLVKNLYIRNLFLMIAVLVILVFAILFWLNIYTRHNQSIIVPSLKGLQVEEARAILKSSKLNCEVVDSVYEKRGIPGAIVDQIPGENSKVKEGRNVYLTIQASTEKLITIPDLQDYSQRQAEALLGSLGFSQIYIEEVPSEYKGLVVAVEYKGVPLEAGRKIPKGSPLTMKVGGGGYGSTSDSIVVGEEEPVMEW